MQGGPIARTDQKRLDSARLRSDATGIGIDPSTGACGQGRATTEAEKAG